MIGLSREKVSYPPLLNSGAALSEKYRNATKLDSSPGKPRSAFYAVYSQRKAKKSTMRRDEGKDDLTSAAARISAAQKRRRLNLSPWTRDERPEQGIIFGSLVDFEAVRRWGFGALTLRIRGQRGGQIGPGC
jgi:hypothetical protein